MPFEEEISKKLAKMPDVVIALFWACICTGAAYIFIYFAKALYTLPRSFDLPWLLIFALVFFVVLVRRRVKIMRQDSKPVLK
jgi:hypothetical protein